MQCNATIIKENSVYKDSLMEIDRRQNDQSAINMGGLTHVTDQTFEFFSLLFTETNKLETMKNLTMHGSGLYNYSYNTLVESEVLWPSFFNIFPGGDQDLLSDSDDVCDSNIMSLFEDLVKQFLSVS